jgi:hypothetical protein
MRIYRNEHGDGKGPAQKRAWDEDLLMRDMKFEGIDKKSRKVISPNGWSD